MPRAWFCGQLIKSINNHRFISLLELEITSKLGVCAIEQKTGHRHKQRNNALDACIICVSLHKGNQSRHISIKCDNHVS